MEGGRFPRTALIFSCLFGKRLAAKVIGVTARQRTSIYCLFDSPGLAAVGHSPTLAPTPGLHAQPRSGSPPSAFSGPQSFGRTTQRNCLRKSGRPLSPENRADSLGTHPSNRDASPRTTPPPTPEWARPIPPRGCAGEPEGPFAPATCPLVRHIRRTRRFGLTGPTGCLSLYSRRLPAT
jgi:hypothetical protein